jgi:hypothetical protein
MNLTTKKMGYLALATSLAIGITMSALTTAVAAPPAVVVYDSIGSTVPGNVPSQPFQAQQTSQFGDRVVLEAGPRNLTSVTVLMSSWGCESGSWNLGDCLTTPAATFSHPLTLTIYNPPSAGLGVGTTIISSTQTFDIPFRPSASTNCTGANAGKWSDGTTCYNGFATPVTFTFDGTVVLPSDLIWGLSFNTSGYGASPLGYSSACAITVQGCGYDALNVGLSQAAAPIVGTDLASDGVYWDTDTAGYYCDGGTAGVGTFRSDAPCWTGFRPMARIQTSDPTVGPPTSKDLCKKDGWKTFNNPSFKNQGDCVSFSNHS